MCTIGFVTYVDLINTSQRLLSILCCNNIYHVCKHIDYNAFKIVTVAINVG